MDISELNDRGLVMLGCGKMGSAMLAGWLAAGVDPRAVHVIDPHPSDWVRAQGVNLNGDFPDHPRAVLLAVKPQMMGAALPQVAALAAPRTVFVSVAAGTTLDTLGAALGQAAIIRAMPNTPAAVGQGITAIIGNAQATDADTTLAQAMLEAIGQVVRLQSEAQMDAVTGVSGSGPAYVFHMIETLAAAGEAEGLPADMAMALAKATVAGAGALAMQADEDPSQLRVNVTSPNGTTQAGLEVLMDDDKGLPPLMRATVHAATERSKELARDG